MRGGGEGIDLLLRLWVVAAAFSFLPSSHAPASTPALFLAPAKPPGDPTGTPIIGWRMAYADALRSSNRPLEAAGQLRSALGHLAAAKGEAAAQASEIAEKLVDALEAAGQLPEARAEMTKCVEARMQLFGRHLVVAKSMTKLARMELAGGGARPDPEAAVLAQNYATNAVALAEEAAALGSSSGGSGSGSSGGGGLQGLWASVTGRGGAAARGSAVERLADRLRVQFELASALAAVAAADRAVATAGASRAAASSPSQAAGAAGGEGAVVGAAALRRASEVLRAAAREATIELAKLGQDGGGGSDAAQVG